MRDDDPWYPTHWKRGDPATEMALRHGIITEAEVENYMTDYAPSQEPHWYRGYRSTEMALRHKVITEAEVETSPLEAALIARGITEDDYHLHLDEMTDEEITLMLNITEGYDYMESIRKAQPKMTDRTYAEILRDF